MSSSKILSLVAATPLVLLVAAPAWAGPAGASFTPPFDLDGMGDSDIMLQRNTAPNEGLLKSLIVDGTTQTGSGFPHNPGAAFPALGGGNLDGDANGQAEIVVRKNTAPNDGLVQAVELDGAGTGLTAVHNVSLVDPAFHLIGAGEMDDAADGNDDLVFHKTTAPNLGLIRTVLVADGFTSKSVEFPGFLPTGFSPIGLGDANEDGRADIWLSRDSDGLIRVLLTGAGGTSISGSAFPAVIGTDYTARGVGFYNPDGRADLVIEKTGGGNPGLVKVLFTGMGGNGITGSAFPVLLSGVQDLVGVGDYDALNQQDLLSRNTSGGNAGLLKTHILNAAGTDRASSGFPSLQSTELTVVQNTPE